MARLFSGKALLVGCKGKLNTVVLGSPLKKGTPTLLVKLAGQVDYRPLNLKTPNAVQEYLVKSSMTRPVENGQWFKLVSRILRHLCPRCSTFRSDACRTVPRNMRDILGNKKRGLLLP